MFLTQQLDAIVFSNNAEWQNEHVSTCKGFIKNICR